MVYNFSFMLKSLNGWATELTRYIIKLMFSHGWNSNQSQQRGIDDRLPALGWGGGVLPYLTLTGTCGPVGYGF